VNQARADLAIPLCCTAQEGRAEVAKQLLRVGALVNRTSDNERSLLFVAAMRGHDEVMKILRRSKPNHGRLFDFFVCGN
jgi:ankyrin repeat protein